MSSLVCNAALCPDQVVLPPKNYQDFCAGKKRKTYGFKGFALLQNGHSITDPTDLAQWQAELDAGNACLGPCGVFDLGTPSYTTSTDDSPCGEEEVLETIYNPTFHTYWVDDENLTHCEYFQNLVKNKICNTLVFFDCDNNLYCAYDSDDVGFTYGMPATPVPTRGDGNKEKWTMTFQIKKDGEFVMCPKKVPGLYELLQDVA